MDLITKLDDERLNAAEQFGLSEWCSVLAASLRAALEREAAALRERDEAREQLCKARELLNKIHERTTGCGCAPMHNDAPCEFASALSSSSPCRHAERVKVLEEENKAMTDDISEYRRQDMAPPPNIKWYDEDGREYVLHWDSGDESVGIHAGWECTELNGLISTMKVIESLFPNWQSFRNLEDCIRCTLAELRRRAGKEGSG